jgi:predicted amidohydrolase YtcJ
MTWSDPDGSGKLAVDAPHGRDGWHPDAHTIAIRHGRIVFVGQHTDADSRYRAQTHIDAGGATIVPGLVDSHTHIFNLGAKLERVDLTDVATEEEAVRLIEEQATRVPPGQWIIGQGWDEGAWADRYPTMTLLSERVPDHPVYMRSLHSFAGWGNKSAFDLAGINADTVAPSGGEIRRFADGSPNGLLLNRAVEMLENALPALTQAQLTTRAELALKRMAADGYVTVHDAGVSQAELAALQALEREQRLPVRVFAMLNVRDTGLAQAWLKTGPDQDNDSFLVTRSVKAFYDGALGSRGARLLDDYSDQPGHRGVSGGEYGFDQDLVTELMIQGFQIGIHAIGDAGNRETLDFIEAVQRTHPDTRNSRHRIEHAQVLHAGDIGRFADLDVIASMEPPHAVEDKTWAQDRLGDVRIRGAYAWRSLREAGARLIFNADNPGSDHSIFYGLHAALTRRDRDRQPPEGWYVDQAMNADETLRAYTTWAAYAGFRENHTGTLSADRWADLSVMDVDPFVLSETDPGAILDGRILMTIVNGQIVHRAADY